MARLASSDVTVLRFELHLHFICGYAADYCVSVLKHQVWAAMRFILPSTATFSVRHKKLACFFFLPPPHVIYPCCSLIMSFQHVEPRQLLSPAYLTNTTSLTCMNGLTSQAVTPRKWVVGYTVYSQPTNDDMHLDLETREPWLRLRLPVWELHFPYSGTPYLFHLLQRSGPGPG